MAELKDERAERFCQEYLVDLKGATAIRRAGFRGKRSDQAAQEYLRKPEVQDRIYELMQQRAHRTRASQDRVATELTRIAFADLHDVVEWGPRGLKVRKSTSRPHDRKAVKSVKERRSVRGEGEDRVETVELTVTMHDRVRALELLAKHVGLGDGGDGGGAGGGAYLIGVPIQQPRTHEEWMELSNRHLAEMAAAAKKRDCEGRAEGED